MGRSPHVPHFVPRHARARVRFEFGRPAVEFRDQFVFHHGGERIRRLKAGPQAVRKLLTLGRRERQRRCQQFAHFRGHNAPPKTNCTSPSVSCRAERYPTTIFTSFPFTGITFLTCLPSSSALTPPSAR